MDTTANAHTQPVQRGDQSEYAERKDLAVAGEPREEHSEILRRRQRDVRDRGSIGDPIIPADDKADTRAERTACVDVEASCGWQHRREFGNGHRAERRVEAAGNPERDNERHVAKGGRDRAWEA